MRVRLTHAMSDAVVKRVSSDLGAALVAHREPYGRTQHEFTLPAIGWRRILDELLRQCYGPAGGKLKMKGRPSESTYLAIGRIAECVKRIEAHPALREAGVPGVAGDVLPAWVDVSGEPGRRYSPYPRVGWEAWLMVPHQITVSRQTVTVWVKASDVERELLEAQCDAYRHDLHLVLAGPLAAA